MVNCIHVHNQIHKHSKTKKRDFDWHIGVQKYTCMHIQMDTTETNTHTPMASHISNPRVYSFVVSIGTHCGIAIRILHAIGNGTLWCTHMLNRGRFVYEYDSSLITGDVTGAHKFLSFVNVLYIRFAIDCTNSQGGTVPIFKTSPVW